MRAFVLGAGLGKRLRPLTHRLPKPLIPVWHKPLICYAFDHLATLGANEFVVNTHHLPETYGKIFEQGHYREAPLHFRNEPVLLETGGGLANVWDLLDAGNGQSFAVYNGDILSDVPLDEAWLVHRASQNLVTLVLREEGAVKNVAFDAATGLVVDLRNALGTDHPNQLQFTGIYFVHPDFYEFLRPGQIESVVEAFLRAIQAGKRIGGVISKGEWWDLGDIPSYLEAHAAMRKPSFPLYAGGAAAGILNVHPKAIVEDDVLLDVDTCVGDSAFVGKGSELKQCIVWPETIVPAGTKASCRVFA